eukprot:COSAG01_NODE_3960_length_5493_cov_2.949203_3_plen_35_part_00
MVQFVLGNFDIERDFPKTTSVRGFTLSFYRTVFA